MIKIILLSIFLTLTILAHSQDTLEVDSGSTNVQSGSQNNQVGETNGHLKEGDSSKATDALGISDKKPNKDSITLYNDLKYQKENPEILYVHKAKNYWASILIGFIAIWGLGIYLLSTTSLGKDQSFDPKTNLLRPLSDRTFSYSKMQLFWWTSIILSCFVSFYLYTGFLVAFTPTIVLLLGGGLATSIFGNVIDNTQIEQNNQPINATGNISPSGSVPIRHQDNEPTNGLFRDILSDEGGITIHRFQAVVFNAVFGLGFLSSFLSNIKNPKATFPFIEFEDWQLTLLGVSAASYLAFKSNENSKATKLERQIEAATDPTPPTPVTSLAATPSEKPNIGNVADIADTSILPSAAFLDLQQKLRNAGLIK